MGTLEDTMISHSLLECAEPEYVLTEGTEKKPLPKGAIARVFFEQAHRADIPTRNGNVYPAKVLEAMYTGFAKQIEAKNGVLMNASHPHHVRDASGKSVGLAEAEITGPRGVAARITESVYDNKTGHLGFHADILETTAGKDLRAILASGAKIGVSCRAEGKTKFGKHEGMHGTVEGNVLQEGASLTTFDFVTDPSVITAWSSSSQVEAAATGSEISEATPDMQTFLDAAKVQTETTIKEALATLVRTPKTDQHQEATTSAPGELQHENAHPMNLDELKKNHPDLYESVRKAAKQEALIESAQSNAEAVARKVLDAEKTIAEAVEKKHLGRIAVLESDNARLNQIIAESMNTDSDDDDDEDEETTEGTDSTTLETALSTSPIVESLTKKMTVLEEENRRLRAKEQKADARAELEKLCENHVLGKAILAATKDKVDNVEEAKDLFEFGKTLVEAAQIEIDKKTKAAAKANGRGSALASASTIESQITESTDQTTTEDGETKPPTVVNRYRRLAGLDG